MLYEEQFLLALFLTLLIEVPIAVWLCNFFAKTKPSKSIFAGITASALTLPYLWFVLPAFIFDRTIIVITGEFLVFIIEAVIYNQILDIKLKHALVVSFVANAASFILGLFLIR